MPRVERLNPHEGDVLQNAVPPTETDLGSYPLGDECKQTILRRISAARRGRQRTVSVYARCQSLKASGPVGGGSRGGRESLQTRLRFAVTYRLVPSRYWSLCQVELKLHFPAVSDDLG